MGGDDTVEIRRLSPIEVDDRLDELAAVLHDCVAGGASIGYVDPFGLDDARTAFLGFAGEIAAGRRLLVAALLGGRLVGAVQVALAFPPNQPHRGEITKLLVRRDARRRGIAERLMSAAEDEARREGKTLLVLDAVSDGDAARLYARMGWVTVGVVPDFALFPDGRFCATTYFYKRL
jgi:GNAT superfamily N-acetyltransferase